VVFLSPVDLGTGDFANPKNNKPHYIFDIPNSSAQKPCFSMRKLESVIPSNRIALYSANSSIVIAQKSQ
jgi:hypothetical protein